MPPDDAPGPLAAPGLSAGALSTSLPERLRLLSYNVQVGVDTKRYREYVTQGWKHLLPHPERLKNLKKIADVLAGFDMVGLQEVDAGSLRSGFVDITEYLAGRAGYGYWFRQVNRNIGMFAQHSNGFLSRLRPAVASQYRLPAGPGRGAMLFEFGTGSDALRVCCVHLALSRRARARQLGFIAELVGDFRHLVVMGDLNTGCESRELKAFLRGANLKEPACSGGTFPSWRPNRRLDHILVSQSLEVGQAKVLDYPISDHLPISLEVHLPPAVRCTA